MCIKCHIGLSDSIVCSNMQDEIDNGSKNFNIYNSTSISHIIIAASGFNGLNIRGKAIKLLENYKNWLFLNPKYVLNNDLTPNKIKILIEKIKNNKVKYHDSEKLEKYLNNLDL